MRTTLAVVAGLVVFAGRAEAQKKCGQPFEVAVGTSNEAIAKMVVDQMFSDIVLSADQRKKAETIVKQGSENASKLDRKAADFQKKIDALQTKRNDDLMKLLTKQSDKAKLTACFKQMEAPARGRGT